MTLRPRLAKAAASQPDILAPPENPPKARAALSAPGHCSATTATATVLSARRSATPSCSAGMASAGSAATATHPLASADSAYSRSRLRLDEDPRSVVALITTTGQLRAGSKLGGAAIVTRAWVTGDSVPRPADLRRSVGSSTLNSLNVPATRPGPATAGTAMIDVSSNASRRIIIGRVKRQPQA